MIKTETIKVEQDSFHNIRELIDKLIEIEKIVSPTAYAEIAYDTGYYDSVETFIEINYQREETKSEKKERLAKEKMQRENIKERELRMYEELKKKYDLGNK